MTYRDRREARAERLDEWAAKREAKSLQAAQAADRIADGIPLGQPILVGHHSEAAHRRDIERIHSGMNKALEHERKAESMSSRADGIYEYRKFCVSSRGDETGGFVEIKGTEVRKITRADAIAAVS